MLRLDRFTQYAWGVLAYNLAVILWGAYVRASGSGAGCGSHWPLCNGQVLPRTPQMETLVEFTHRLTSGLALLLVIGLVIWAFRRYAKGSQVRLGAGLALVFMVSEALLGAGLVLFKLVAQDTSTTRAVVGALHLINTFLLIGALALTAWWAAGGRPVRWGRRRALAVAVGVALAAMLLLGASGAVTALGDTLFPAASLAEGWQQKFSPTAHFLVRLRLFHPIIAVAVGAYIIIVMGVINAQQPDSLTRRFSRIFTLLYGGQLAAGALNVVLLAPIWLQLLHLFISDLLWIILILFVASAFAQKVTRPEASPIRSTSPLQHSA